MEPDAWQRVDDLFQAALDCDPEARAALLDARCGNDLFLREQVESLLAYQTSGLTETPAFQDGVRLLEKSRTLCGRRIGAYYVIREIGRGGMGSVYLAARADAAYQKLVAIKIIRQELDTEEVVRRFLGERHILAALDHPHIARLLDAGTTEEGLPYFVMEYIEGLPIDQYCERRALTITERLRLFQGVCAAVQYAHQHLIVHRDIKPANVLVTSEGVPRLLDFGIAKLLAPGTAGLDGTLTNLGPRTPQYASPEQVRGEVVTTASDVYSLGVLLYGLLTGQRPYGAGLSSAAEIERAICEEEPPKPSVIVMREAEPDGMRPEEGDGPAAPVPDSVRNTRRNESARRLRRRLQGDLDTIVLTALRKEPSRRYASVEQFSEDISRYLENLPVMARPDSRRYRVAKFVARHRAGVAAALLVVISLVGGIVGTSWQARVARAERGRAQQQFNDVRKLATSFLFEFNSSIQRLPGATPARQLLVQRALEYLSKLARQSAGDPGLQQELAEAYLKVGDLQGNPYEPNLGDTRGAADSYRKALAISAGLVRGPEARAEDATTRRYLARSYQSLGEVLPLLGAPVEGADHLRTASGIFEALTAAAPEDRELRLQLANCYQSLGDLLGHSGLMNLGDRIGALDSYRKAVRIFDSLAALQDLRAKGGAAVLRIRIGDMQQAEGDLDGARASYGAALALAESLAAANPQNDRFQRGRALAHRKVGDLASQLGDFKQALQHALEATATNRALAAADPNNAQAQMNLALSLKTTAEALIKTGDELGALATYREALGMVDKLAGAAPTDVFRRGQLAELLIATGGLLTQRGNQIEARRLTLRGLVISGDLAGRPAATPDELSQYALTLLTCEPSDLRDPVKALRNAQHAVEKSRARDPKSLDILAQAYFENGDSAHAIDTEKRILELLPAPRPDHRVWPARQRVEAQLARFVAGPHDEPVASARHD